MNGPLHDLLVLDLTTGVTGPFGTKHLADFGAKVVKIEPPLGDETRCTGPFAGDDPHPEKSGLFLYLNTNKRGVTLNLADATGRRILKELAMQADMIVESFGPGMMEQIGLGYEPLSNLNPALTLVSLSDFGATGPYRDYRLTDIVAFALTGPMYQFGEPDRAPLRLFNDATLYFAGLSLANAVVGGAVNARRTGRGSRVELSIAESFLANTQRHTLSYLYGGDIQRRIGAAARPQFLTGGYPSGDGYIAVQGSGRGESWWPRVFRMIGQMELYQEDSRFQDSRAIMENRDEFDALWYAWLLEHTREEIFDAAAEARFPLAPVYTTEDIHNDPHFNDRGFFQEIEHPVAGAFRYPTSPFRLHGATSPVRLPAPLLGQHNDEVYCGMLGLSRVEMASLRRSGVI